MIRRWRIVAILPLVLASLTACERVVEPTAEPELAPQIAQQILSADSGDRTETVLDADGNEYTLVEGSLTSLTSGLHVGEIIGADGGSLHLAGHTLTVPAGAVSTPTLFLMVVLPNGNVEVELRALVSSLFGLIDVGEQGFEEGVSLSLTYAGATNVDDPDRLAILHLRDDGTAEPLPSVVDPASRTVTAELEHFSRYCMASY